MKETAIRFISGGTATSTPGFRAGAVYAGIKKKGENVLDLGVLFSEVPCVAAGTFTTNRIKSAPVVLSQERIKRGRAVAIVANSGCANASTGKQGLADAREMTSLVATSIGASPEDVLLTSTGVIGRMLPMDLIREGIGKLVLSTTGGHDLARAIMTTDTVPKEVAVSARLGEKEFVIGGVAKGAGMIHPNMGTMFCFLTTNVAVELDFLRSALRRAVDKTFNMISVDGDTSPSDTVIAMANGLLGNKPVTQGSQESEIFQQALDQVCLHLAKSIARDGEGATRLIEVTVNGAKSLTDARSAARTVVSSNLVKSAVHGADPNWGRVLVATGRSGAEMVEDKIGLYIGNINLVKSGMPVPFKTEDVIRVLKQPEVPIRVELNLGTASATAWGCDLSEEYVTINSEYTT